MLGGVREKMRFEKKYGGIHYAITLRPRHSSKPEREELKTLRELEIEIYRKSPEGRRGYTWKVLFFDGALRIERYEYSDLGWCKAEVSIRAEWLEKEKWYLKDVERTIRDLGVDKAVEHILSHLKIIFDHPLTIPLIR
jgi:hypothetical protein